MVTPIEKFIDENGCIERKYLFEILRVKSTYGFDFIDSIV